jgi:excisionase family DNA binding protein
MNTLPELISVKELMNYLHCSKSTAYALCKRRDFPSFRIGKSFYIKTDDLSQWIDKESHKNKIL